MNYKYFTKNKIKKLVYYFGLLFVLLAAYFFGSENNVHSPTAEVNGSLGVYQIDRVVDGDTIRVFVDNKSISVRLIGIDSPETNHPNIGAECMGAEASAAAKEMLGGKSIILESDPSQGDKDDYERLLRYVFLEDGTNFNKWMIEEGYAREFTYYSKYKYQSQFKQAEIEAKSAEKGLWSSRACK